MKYWAFSLCYNEPWVIRESLTQYYKTKSPVTEVTHVLVNHHWPISSAKFEQEIAEISKEFGCILLDPGKNLGLARGYNWAVSQMKVPDDALVVGYDPDSYPMTPGWDWAALEVMNAVPSIGWVSLMHVHANTELYERRKGDASRFIKGIQITPINAACMNSVCGIRGAFFNHHGGFQEVNPLYGGLEVHTYPKVKEAGYEWVFLNNYAESEHFTGKIHKDYVKWKWDTAHLGQPQIDFGEWLKKNSLNP